MKNNLSYEELKDVADKASAYLLEKYCSTGPGGCRLVAVTRGGLTFAHRVAYNMSKPLSFFMPKTRQILWGEDATVQDRIRSVVPLIFLEDVLATGRTFSIVDEWCRDWGYRFEFLPSVMDAQVDRLYFNRVNNPATIVTSEWMVFPYEDFLHVQEGDRGLFRDGTSEGATKLTPKATKAKAKAKTSSQSKQSS